MISFLFHSDEGHSDTAASPGPEQQHIMGKDAPRGVMSTQRGQTAALMGNVMGNWAA